MLNRTRMAVAAVLVLCVSSAAYAGGSRNDADPDGGYPVGPMGQIFGSGVNPAFHPDLFGKPEKAYDSVGFPQQQTRPRKKVNSR
jgi:hypothetical protein